MSKNDKQRALVPQLRFPEFQDAPAWEEKQLKQLFDERTEKGGEELPLLSLTDAEGLIHQEYSGRKDNSNADKSRYARVCPGDIVYNTMRMWEGRSALASEAGLVSPAYTVCTPKGSADSKFFAYYFKTAQAIEQFRRFSQGLVKDTLSLKFERFSKIRLATTSLPEQQKIADCLSSLDDLIAAEGRKLAALRDHKKGLMQQLFPREGETRPWLRFPEFRDAGEWKHRPLYELGEIITGKTPSTKDAGLWNGNIQFITPTDISDDRKYQHSTERTIAETENTRALPEGAILYTCIASIGKMAITTCRSVTNQQINAIITNSGVNNEFVYYALANLTPWIKSIPASSTMPIINKTEFSSISLPIPEENAEQQRIADCLSTLDALITAQAEKLDALRTHKRGLMQQLFPAPEEVGA